MFGVHVFSEIDRGLHDKMARHIASAYSMSAIVELEPLVDSCIKIFIQKLGEHIDNRSPLDMVKWFQWYAFDVIGELTFSKPFGFLETECDVDDAIRNIHFLLYYVSVVGQAFGYHWLLLGNPLISSFIVNAAGGVIKNVSQMFIFS